MYNKPDGSRTPFENVFKKIDGITAATLTTDNTVILEVRHDFEWRKEGKKLLDQLNTLERAVGYVNLTVKRQEK